MSYLLVVKAVIVIFFLLMFLRRPNWVWGIGLLTVTTAVLLDTFLGTFGRAETESDLGYFLYAAYGALMGGAAVWAWGLLRPLTATNQNPIAPAQTAVAEPMPAQFSYDQQQIYNDIHQRLGADDILDLLFDIGINENEVVGIEQTTERSIRNLIERAEEKELTSALSLAVERVLTPVPPENLPRLEKITADSPPAVLRRYLLAHYQTADLEKMTADLGIDWEQLGAGGKKENARNLLLYLIRRNRLDELLELMKGANDQET